MSGLHLHGGHGHGQHGHGLNQNQQNNLVRLATHVAVGAAVLLVVGKTWAWWVTGSVSMLSSLTDSSLDLLASFINFLAVRHALEPADDEHRFGHGKAEALAGMGQSAFIGGSGFFLLFESINRMSDPSPVTAPEIGISVSLAAMAVTLALVAFQAYVIKRSGSLAVQADSLHYRGDLLLNSATMLAIFLSSQFGWVMADPSFGFIIAGYILWGAWAIFRQSYDVLMDRELPDEERERIREIALGVPGVLGVHELRTRSAGMAAFIQLHVDMDADLTLGAAHVIADQVEDAIRQAFPHADVLTHADPAGIQETRKKFS